MPVIVAEKIAEITSKINKEIAVYINRKGVVIDIIVGDSKTAPLSEVSGRRDSERLTGIRCIHTHPESSGRLSDVDEKALLQMNFDSMIGLGVKNGNVMDVFAGILSPQLFGELDEQLNIEDYVDIYGPYNLGDDKINDLFQHVYDIDEVVKSDLYKTNDGECEKAILVGLDISNKSDGKIEANRSLEELVELTLSAGAEVMEIVLQKRDKKDPAFLIGKGKVFELAIKRQTLEANVIIFDQELSGAQVRNLESLTGAKIIDRTMLILDIFAQRAKSREGKLQVELAQLKYRLPRLVGAGVQLSRQGGGIGTRGPGESKLEVDRRNIRKKVTFLENQLKVVSHRKKLLREKRETNAFPVVALVGYTNAGKSTLLNALCESDVLAENKLFATLDPTIRKMKSNSKKEILMVDTVGFVSNLPHDLVEAFKSTLDEIISADLLVYVLDSSSKDINSELKVVQNTLDEIGVLDKSNLLVLNKMDLVENIENILIDDCNDVLRISALNGEGVEALKTKIEILVSKQLINAEGIVPYSEGWVLPYIHKHGDVLEEEYTDNGIRFVCSINQSKISKIKDFIK